MRYRALSILVILLLSILFASEAIAQDEKSDSLNNSAEYSPNTVAKDNPGKVTIPPGMELRKIGSLNLIVPEGSRIRKDRSQWIMEGPEDFAARSISEIKKRLDGIEKEQGELKKSIEELKAVMEARL